MKKFVALLLAVCLMMAAGMALAEDLELKIAHIGPQTGGAAVYGLATYRGAKIAVDEINATDNGVTIVLLNEDDTHDAEKAVNAYNNVMEQGAQMIVGTTTTAPCIAVGAKAYEERVFMLTPSASSTDVAAVINEKQLGTKIAVIYNNADAYSTGIYQTFVQKAAELGLEIVSTTTFTDETTDFSVQVADAKAKGADLVGDMSSEGTTPRQYTDLLGRVLGFRDFIRTAEIDKLNELVEEDPQYFYHVMPYAYVFGLSNKWIKNFEDLPVVAPNWYRGTRGFDSFDYYMMGRMMSDCSASVGNNIVIPTPSHGSSGGSGGSGIKGDVDGDGTVDVNDVQTTINIILKK